MFYFFLKPNVMNTRSIFTTLCFLSFVPLSIFGQSTPKKLIGSFVLEDKTYTYEFVSIAIDENILKISYPFEGPSAKNENIPSAEPKSSSDPAKPTEIRDSATYLMHDFAQDSFVDNFKIQMIDKFKYPKDPVIDEMLKKKGTALFFEIKARLELIDDEPVTANLLLTIAGKRPYLLRKNKT